jgi:hypothetical protein
LSFLLIRRVSDPDPHGSALFELLDQDPGGQKFPTKIEEEKSKKKLHVMRAGCYLLGAKGFSCSLGVLYGRLGISKYKFLKVK